MTTSPDSVTYPASINEIVGPTEAAPWEATLRPTNPWQGLFGFDTLSDVFEFYDGTSWKHPLWVEGGTITGNLEIDGTLGVDGATTLRSTLGVTGVSTFTNDVSITGSKTLLITGAPGNFQVANGQIRARNIDATSITGTALAVDWTGATSSAGYAAFRTAYSPSGTPTSGTIGFMHFNIISDSMDATGATGYPGVLRVNHNINTGAKGDRVGIYYEGRIIAPLALDGVDNEFYASFFSMIASYNVGGTGFGADSRGRVRGGYLAGALQNTATFYSAVMGLEINTVVATGASCGRKWGMVINLTADDANQAGDGAGSDAGIALAKASAAAAGSGWLTVFQVGSNIGYAPHDPVNGVIMRAFRGPEPAPLTALDGIDLSDITFSGATFRGVGFEVDGSGNTTAASFEVGAAGPTITTGAGVPGTTTPVGSMYLRTGGGVGTTLYVSQGAGVWNAVAGV